MGDNKGTSKRVWKLPRQRDDYTGNVPCLQREGMGNGLNVFSGDNLSEKNSYRT